MGGREYGMPSSWWGDAVAHFNARCFADGLSDSGGLGVPERLTQRGTPVAASEYPEIVARC